MLPLEAQFAATFFISIVACCMVTFFVMHLMRKANVLDIPDQPRKIHDKPIPLGGGVALGISIIVAMYAAYDLGWLTDDRVPAQLLVGLAFAAVILVAGGLADDRWGLRWWQQLGVTICASIVVIAAGLEISFISNPLGGILHLNEWQIPLTAGRFEWQFSPIADTLLFFWLLGMMYTTKLLDGIDGLTTSIGSIAALVIFIVSLTWDRTGSTTSFLALAVAGSALGFLVWNWHPAKIFLGEGGSTLLGFLLAVLAVISGGKIATALLVMGIPMLDVIWIIGRRLRSGRKLYAADEKHLHFRLLKKGLSQRQVVVFLSLLSLLFGSVSFFASTRGKLIALTVLVIVMITIAHIVTRRHKGQSNA